MEDVTLTLKDEVCAYTCMYAVLTNLVKTGELTYTLTEVYTQCIHFTEAVERQYT